MGRFRDILIAWGPTGVFAACLIESAGVPSPGGSDALLLLVTIAKPSSLWLCAFLATLGSMIGSVIFHHIISRSAKNLLDRHTATPRGRRIRDWFHRYGVASVFVCALVPLPMMPLKLMTLCACALGVSRNRYLGVMLAARLPRYILIAYLGATLGQESSAWFKNHIWEMAIFAVALMGGLYLLLKLAERRTAAALASRT
jgi:membrane protein YqaA with SNARE-associated domain